MRPPTLKPLDLTADSEQQHAHLLETFAQHLFWIRNSVLGGARRAAESEDARARLGGVFRRPYDDIAQLSPEHRPVAYRYAQSCVDEFATELLALLGNEGFDLVLGRQHAVRYRVEAEICDTDSGDVVAHATISRDGPRFLPENWGRWLNRYGTHEFELDDAAP